MLHFRATTPLSGRRMQPRPLPGTIHCMLVVRVEIWPGGDPGFAREIGRARLANVSDLADVSDYVCVCGPMTAEGSSL